MTAKYVGLGVKFAGRCLVCGTDTGSREWEKQGTLLYKKENNKFGVAHPRCANAQIKTKVGGGVALRVQPDETIEVQHE
jgi:hypothetical protein